MMNERLKELAGEARLLMFTDDKDHHYVSDGNLQRFAELIVRECATVVDEKTVDNGFGTADGWCEGSDLLKHFGVK